MHIAPLDLSGKVRQEKKKQGPSCSKHRKLNELVSG